MTFKQFLLDMHIGHLGPACDNAIEWLGDRTPEQALADCHRGDWLLWWAENVGVDRRKLVLCAGHCVNTVRDLMPDEHSIEAVDAAIAYGEGLISAEELEKARVLAYAAADAARAASRRAALAASAAACAATTVAYAYAAARRAASAAKNQELNQVQTADIVRRMLGDEILERTKTFVK